MSNIVIAQIQRLVKERWFDLMDAIDYAYKTQERKWHVKNGKITTLWDAYYKLWSEWRALLRRANETGKSVKDYIYQDGRALLKPKKDV